MNSHSRPGPPFPDSAGNGNREPGPANPAVTVTVTVGVWHPPAPAQPEAAYPGRRAVTGSDSGSPAGPGAPAGVAQAWALAGWRPPAGSWHLRDATWMPRPCKCQRQWPGSPHRGLRKQPPPGPTGAAAATPGPGRGTPTNHREPNTAGRRRPPGCARACVPSDSNLHSRFRVHERMWTAGFSFIWPFGAVDRPTAAGAGRR